MNTPIKFLDFIKLYQLLLKSFKKEEKDVEISFHYLDEFFYIKIENKEENKVFTYNLTMTEEEYYFLLYFLLKDFIENHPITLPIFSSINRKDTEIYYQSKESIHTPLDYDKAKIHIIKNSFFTFKVYYFKGLNSISYEIQDMALNKLNQKVYIKK